MFTQCWEGISKKKFLITTCVVFIYTYATDFVIHGLILGDTYKATAHLWRPEIDMKAKCIYMMGGHLIMAFFFTLIFLKGYKGTGYKEGLRYGKLIGLYSAGPSLITYAVMPIPCKIIAIWIVAGLVQAVIGGAIAACMYDCKGKCVTQN